MVAEDIEEVPLTVDFSRTLMHNFVIKSKLTRDAVVYQCLLYLSYAIKAMKMDKFVHDNPSHAINEGKLTVGIVGAGIMGKTLFELLHKRTLFGRNPG